jgi:cytochrome c
MQHLPLPAVRPKHGRPQPVRHCRPASRYDRGVPSPANKDSGLTWDAATLDRYLTSPSTVVPHTIMTYAGLKDTQKRTDLIAYLSTLH